jgi:Tol biopolymer transport system component
MDSGGRSTMILPPSNTMAFTGRPDIGGQLALATNEGGVFQIMVIDFATGQRKRLTQSPEPGDAEPFWSPDGRRVAFTAGKLLGGEYRYHIESVDLDFKRQVLVTEGAYNGAPAYSPDGNKLVFHTNRDGDFEVYLANADGSDQVNLSNNPGFNDASAVWSPDGKLILFASDRGDGNFRLYTMKPDGTEQRLLVNLSGYAYDQGRFSPSGNRIAITVRQVAELEIHIALVNADGSNYQQITSGLGQFRDPFWIDEDTLLVSARPSLEANWQIYLLELGQSGILLTPITSGQADHRNPVWIK